MKDLKIMAKKKSKLKSASSLVKVARLALIGYSIYISINQAIKLVKEIKEG